jgi:hypothetical protein
LRGNIGAASTARSFPFGSVHRRGEFADGLGKTGIRKFKRLGMSSMLFQRQHVRITGVFVLAVRSFSGAYGHGGFSNFLGQKSD